MNSPIFPPVTLRDYFAAHMVGAILSVDINHAPGFSPRKGEDGNMVIARIAYELADAMLAERAK